VSAVKNFIHLAGEDVTLSMTARDATGAILNLTGATIAWKLALNAGDTALVSKTGTIVSAAAGTFTVALVAADTADLYGDYVHQAIVTISGAVTVGVRGIMRIEAMNQ
jgi:hypothetical protein